MCSPRLCSPRGSGPAGSAGVGALHVRQGPAAAALDGHGEHATGAGGAVARTGTDIMYIYSIYTQSEIIKPMSESGIWGFYKQEQQLFF